MYVRPGGTEICLGSFLNSILDVEEWPNSGPAALTNEKDPENPLDRRLG